MRCSLDSSLVSLQKSRCWTRNSPPVPGCSGGIRGAYSVIIVTQQNTTRIELHGHDTHSSSSLLRPASKAVCCRFYVTQKSGLHMMQPVRHLAQTFKGIGDPTQKTLTTSSRDGLGSKGALLSFAIVPSLWTRDDFTLAELHSSWTCMRHKCPVSGSSTWMKKQTKLAGRLRGPSVRLPGRQKKQRLC